MEFSLFLTVPSAVALAVIGAPIVAVLFGRGAWTDADTAATALALAVYALGLPAFVLQKVLQPLYYAREDTRRPFKFALTSMVVNAAVAIGLMPFIGFVAAAWATTFAAWVMVWQLWRGARGMGQAAQIDAQMRRRALRIAVASAAMGLALYGGAQLLAPYLALSGWRYLALLALIALGAVVYLGLGQAIGAYSARDIRNSLRRNRSALPQPDKDGSV